MKKIFFIVSLVLSFFVSGNLSQALAVTTPSFPVCANPQGEILATYNSGTHGVPGDGTTYNGSDTVYKIDQDIILQCLCPDNGEGIQTNWWKVADLSESDINVLVSQGWILVPDGSAWGLSSAAYLAKNISFSCKSSNNNSTNSSSNSNGTSGGGGVGGGQILGASTILQAVLGLATTGSYPFILGVIIIGLIALSMGILLRFKK